MSLYRYLLKSVVAPVFMATTVFISLLFGLPKAHASETAVDQSINAVQQVHRSGAENQLKVDDLSVESRALYQEYQQVLRQAETTEAYNRQLSRLIDSQQEELTSMDRQIQSLEDTDRSLLPMLVRMVSTLEQFVAQDQPFLLDERQQRVARLQTLLDRADVSLAEKYRLILQAYQVEADYGRSLEAYEGEVSTEAGQRRVTFLRLGRVALYYQSANGKTGGLWLPDAQQWQALDGDENRVLKNAIAMARQQIVPELLNLPLPLPSAVSVSTEGDA
ncbi:DUF3450 domain-containing protein [Oceanospirillum sp.]|uniref:DUF3450 domain-containing protein n=1 Tax=Oceanospirillum sp. TaxID=2021254 RepID=UPI003A92A088